MKVTNIINNSIRWMKALYKRYLLSNKSVPNLNAIREGGSSVSIDLHYHITDHIQPSLYGFEKIRTLSPAAILNKYEHDFSFLRELSYTISLGEMDQEITNKARKTVLLWMESQSTLGTESWAPVIVANRLYFWSLYYNKFFVTADNKFKTAFIGYMIMQMKHLMCKVALCNIDYRFVMTRGVLACISGFEESEIIQQIKEHAMQQMKDDLLCIIGDQDIGSVTIFNALKCLLSLDGIRQIDAVSADIGHLMDLSSNIIYRDSIASFHSACRLSYLMPEAKKEVVHYIKNYHSGLVSNVGNIAKLRIEENTLFICRGGNNVVGSFELYVDGTPIIVNRHSKSPEQHSMLQMPSMHDRISNSMQLDTDADIIITRVESSSQRYKMRYTREILLNESGIFGRDTLNIGSKMEHVYIKFHIDHRVQTERSDDGTIALKYKNTTWEFGCLENMLLLQHDSNGSYIEVCAMPSKQSIYWYMCKRF